MGEGERSLRLIGGRLGSVHAILFLFLFFFTSLCLADGALTRSNEADCCRRHDNEGQKQQRDTHAAGGCSNYSAGSSVPIWRPVAKVSSAAASVQLYGEMDTRIRELYFPTLDFLLRKVLHTIVGGLLVF